MKGRKRTFNVILSRKAKFYGLLYSFGFVTGLFGICWFLIALFMENDFQFFIGIIIGLIGALPLIYANKKHTAEYDICISDSIYTTILWNKKDGEKYIIIQDGFGEIIEVNYKPVKKVFQTTGRHIEKI